MSYARNLSRLSRTGAPVVNSLQDIRDLTIYDNLYPPGVIARGHTTPDDGGGGYFNIITGQTPGHYTDDNGITVVFAGGDGSAAAVRDFTGEVYAAWYGFGEASSAAVNDAAFASALAVVKRQETALIIPNGISQVSNINIVGTSNIVIRGESTGATLDFASAPSGVGISVTYDDPEGGSKYVQLVNLSLTDSRDTSLLDTMVQFRGGPTLQTPSQTSGHQNMQDVRVLQFNNPAGTAVHVSNISHVILLNVALAYELGCGEGLVIDNDLSINTGVITITNCYFTGMVRGMRIEQQENLLDGYSITGNFFSSWTNALAQEAVRFSGVLAAINFTANHIEARPADLSAGIVIDGNLNASVFSANHFSCGSGTDYATYGMLFEGASMKGCTFESNEFLRVKNAGDGGYCYWFDNACTLFVDQSCSISNTFKNFTKPTLLGIETGGNEDLIYSGLNVNANEFCRSFVIPDASAISFTPGREDGSILVTTNSSVNSSGICRYVAEGGTEATDIIGGGANFHVTTGPLTGVEATGGLTVSASTDKKIYIQNRLGFQTTVAVQFLGGYFVNQN